jgi:hypothetical protein
MTGIAKAWVNYNGVAQTITNSFNVSSVTYNSLGNYTVNFTTAMPNANYCAFSSGNSPAYVGAFDWSTARTTSAINVLVFDVNGVIANSTIVNIAILSS